MKNIAIDIDDTLADFTGKFILFFNKEYGTKLVKENFFSYLYHGVLNISAEKKEEILKIFYTTNYFKEITPMPDSLVVIPALKKRGYNLFIVTGRSHSFTQETETWIERYFPNTFSGIYHTNSFSSVGDRIKKSKVCTDLNAKLIIEDDWMHVTDCAKNGIQVLVYDNPWNQGKLPKEATRVSNWNEILEKI